MSDSNETDSNTLPDKIKYDYDFKNSRTVTNPDSPIYEQDLLAAIMFTAGNYTKISELLLRPRSEIKKLVENTPYIYDYCLESRESIVDIAEDNIFKLVRVGDKDISKFVLQTLGKERGYSTRAEAVDRTPPDQIKRSSREIAKALAQIMQDTGVNIIDITPEGKSDA